MSPQWPPTVVVTGASSGIGRELARCAAADGARLVLTARSTEALEHLARKLADAHGADSVVVPVDLAAENGPRRLAEALEEDGRPVDVLVNNAGFGLAGRFAEQDRDDVLGMIDLDVRALVELTHRLLPAMLARGEGAILNVASTAAFQPGPLMAVYYAAKAFVLSFSEALAEELDGTGLRVTTLCPGPVPTGFQQRARMETSRLMTARGLTRLDAGTVARAGWNGVRRGERLVVPGTMNRLGAFGTRLLPRRLVTRMVREINRTD
jgi:hypothetical protein